MDQKTDVPVAKDAAEKAATARGRTPAPWPGFGNLRTEIERLFDSFEPGNWFERMPIPSGGVLTPAIDLTEKNGGYEVTAELPGLDPEKVELKVSGGVLTLRGEKTEEKDEERKDYHLSERRWGSFQRAVRLPDDVDQEKIEASFANGVLTVKLPKSEKALAAERRIDIRKG